MSSSLSQRSYSNISSIGSGSLSFGGGGARSSFGYLGGIRSHVGYGLGSGVGIGLGLAAASARFGSSMAVSGGGRFGLGFASGGGSGRFGMAAGGGGGGGAGFWTGGSSIADGGVNPFATNEKMELQTLNNRLATYLDKVKRLETANRELEEMLRGFKANTVQKTYDMQAYQNQLQPLRDQLTDFLKECSHLALLIDNNKLAADDLRIKYENEVAVRQTLEGDIAALKAIKREYDLTSATLKHEHQILLNDRDMINSNYQTEVLALRGQMAGTLTVDVQSTDSMDLSRRLTDLRSEYESIVEKNHREIENWYTKKLESTQVERTQVTDVTVTGSTEIATRREQILTLQTEFDALLLQKSQQEQRLLDIQGQKQMQLLSLSQLAGNLECELASVRESALQQAQDYQMLLSTKIQLEREIATYKSLLEFTGDLSKFPGMGHQSSPLSLFDQISVAASSEGESIVAEPQSVSSDSGEGAVIEPPG